MCRCTAYCVLVKTSDYFQKLINLINNCERCWRTPGARRGCLVATSDLSRGNTEGDMCTVYTLHHSVATLPTPVWKFLSSFHLQYTPFHLKFINICLLSVVHSPVNNAPLTTWQLVWKPTKYILNSYQHLKPIWNLKSQARITDHIIILLLLLKVCSNSFTLDRISQTLIGVCNLTVVAQ